MLDGNLGPLEITRCDVIPLASQAGGQPAYRVAYHDVLTYPTFRTMDDARRYADALRAGRLQPAFFEPGGDLATPAREHDLEHHI